MGTGASGTASSIALTPVQGLQLVDPKMQAKRKRKAAEEDDRWLKGGTFTQINSGSSVGVNAGAREESGGFKVPGLPAKKMKRDG